MTLYSCIIPTLLFIPFHISHTLYSSFRPTLTPHALLFTFYQIPLFILLYLLPFTIFLTFSHIPFNLCQPSLPTFSPYLFLTPSKPLSPPQPSQSVPSASLRFTNCIHHLLSNIPVYPLPSFTLCCSTFPLPIFLPLCALTQNSPPPFLLHIVLLRLLSSLFLALS